MLCTQCVLSIFVEISSLDASARTFDISSIRTFLVSDQECSLAWCLMFLKIRVFLKDLFFNSVISLSSSLIVLFCLLIYSFWSMIWNSKPYFITVLTSFNSRLFCIFFNLIQFQIKLKNYFSECLIYSCM